MAEKRRGLGRGLGALIPQSTKNSGNAETKASEKTAAAKTAPKKVSTPIEEPMTDGLFEMAHEAKPEKQRKSTKAESVEGYVDVTEELRRIQQGRSRLVCKFGFVWDLIPRQPSGRPQTHEEPPELLNVFK